MWTVEWKQEGLNLSIVTDLWIENGQVWWMNHPPHKGAGGTLGPFSQCVKEFVKAAKEQLPPEVICQFILVTKGNDE